MMFGFGKALKGLGGLLKGGEGGDFVQGRSLFDFMGRDAMDRVGKGLDSLSMARALSDGDYGTAFGLLSDMKRRKRMPQHHDSNQPQEHVIPRRGFGGGVY